MDQTSKYAATRITSRKNTSSLQEMLTQAEIRSQRRIICSTPNITFGLLPLRRLHKRWHRVVSSGRPARMRMTSKMTAILTRCRIASPRPRSGRTLTRSRNKDFNRNRALRRTPHNRLATGRLSSPSARAATIGGALRLGRIVRATDFRIEVRDPIALTKTATRAIATTDMDATVAHGISGRIAIPSRRVNPPQMRRRRRGFRPS
jgi:hypothetical protein